ncbi:MAG: glycosyltransferase family 4 protein [Granulosicoccus sp.]
MTFESNATHRPRLVLYNTYEPVVSLFRDLPEALSASGFDVEIVISRSEYRARNIRLEQHFNATNVKVTRVGYGFKLPVSSRAQKLIVMLSYIICAGFHLLTHRSRLRIFLTQPPFFSLLGAFLKRVRHEEYAVVMMDMYPEVLEAGGLINRNSVPGKLLNRLAYFSRKHAGRIIAIGVDMQQHLADTGIPDSRLAYIPNWSSLDTPERVPNTENQLRRQFSFSAEDIIILYSGNMGVSHYFSDLLEVAKRSRNNPRLKFVFIGGGPRKNEIESFKARHELNNIHLFGYQPADLLKQSLSAGDIHFVSVADGFGGMVVPSKVFGSLAVGRPILFQGDKNSELAKMLEKHQCGQQVAVGAVDELEELINTYSRQPSLLEEHGIAALTAYKTCYAKEVGITRYLNVIRALTENNMSNV